ncbi:MAG: CopG family ribbon-helix-helix protein [Candidatus Altiarchaeota archaeon]|nr:CopG family ribbon-helix-helix protein [Candidatus Altiarchaeota archaeon]
MSIVSISLKEKLIKEVDDLREGVGYSSRSEVVRAGLRLLLEEHNQKSMLSGRVDALLLLTHDENSFDDISRIRHHHQRIIKMQLHSHLENDKCLEVMLLNGDAKDIKKITDEYQTNKRIHNIKLVII